VLQWRAQLRDWAPDLRPSTVLGSAEERMQAWRRDADVFLTSYDSLRGDILLPDPAGPRHRDWAVVIVDEAQRIKNRDTEAAIVVKRLRARRAWALTGTPLENRADDLVSILEFVAPGQFDRREMMAGLPPAAGPNAATPPPRGRAAGPAAQDRVQNRPRPDAGPARGL